MEVTVLGYQKIKKGVVLDLKRKVLNSRHNSSHNSSRGSKRNRRSVSPRKRR